MTEGLQQSKATEEESGQRESVYATDPVDIMCHPQLELPHNTIKAATKALTTKRNNSCVMLLDANKISKC